MSSLESFNEFFNPPEEATSDYAGKVNFYSASPNATFYDSSSAADRLNKKTTETYKNTAKPDDNIEVIRADVTATIKTSPVGEGVVRSINENVIGTGLVLNSVIDREYLRLTDEQADALERVIEQNFANFMTDLDSSHDRRFDGYQNVAKAFNGAVLDGDSFLVVLRNRLDHFPYRFSLKFVPAGFCCNPQNKGDTGEITGGIQLGKNDTPSIYHFANIEKTASGKRPDKWTPVTARDRRGLLKVIHWKFDDLGIKIRPTPPLLPIIRILKQITDLTDAELTTAVNQAFLAVATNTEKAVGLKGPSTTEGAVRPGQKNKLEVGPAMHIPLRTNETIELLTPGHPNPNMEPFMVGMIGHISMGTGIPREILMKVFQASYSASRAALEVAKSRWRIARQDAARYMQMIHERLLYDAVLDGTVSAPGFLQDYRVRRAYMGDYRYQWIGTGFPVIDEKKELEGAEIALRNCIKTYQQVTAETNGGDWFRNVDRSMRERARKKELDDKFGPTENANSGDDTPNKEDLDDE